MVRTIGMAALLLLAGSLQAQTGVPGAAAKSPKTSFYLQAPLPVERLLPPPPEPGSTTERAELAELHRLERTRTPAQVAAAQRDDHGETIFDFSTVLGPGFNASALPLTSALSRHMENEAEILSSSMKKIFKRPRPYLTDTTLHPVCDLAKSYTYPSGHSLVGYMEGFALAEMLPAQNAVILARARAFAHNRLVCGVHYESDTEASRTAALVYFGAILATPKLQAELAAARQEIEAKLGAKAPAGGTQ